MFSRNKKIILATGEYPPRTGGPSLYVFHLEQELRKREYNPVVVTYGWEYLLPTGIRHIVYTMRLFVRSIGAQTIWTFDTYSAGLPACFVSFILRKEFVIRIGGDFLWENFVNRTKKNVLLSDFYKEQQNFNFKEKCIYFFTKRILVYATHIVFSTKWQKDIWYAPYDLDKFQVSIIENAYVLPHQDVSQESTYGLFVSPSRNSAVKNKEILRSVMDDIVKDNPDVSLDENSYSYSKHIERIRCSYAVIITSLSEVSPNLLLDSLMCNKPFILTKDCGYAQRYKDCGILVDPNNKNEIKAAIIDLLDEHVYHKYQNAIQKLDFSRTYEDIGTEFLSISKVR